MTAETRIETLEAEGLLIDADTGEIIEWPEGVTTDRFEWMKQKMIEAGAQMRRWEALGGFYKQALGRMLDQMGVKKHEGVQWVAPGPRRVLDPIKMADWMLSCEVPADIQLKVYRETVKAVDAAVVVDIFRDDSLAALVEERPSKPYIRFDVQARSAPSIHKGTTEEEGD